jgi:hypothetical protein
MSQSGRHGLGSASFGSPGLCCVGAGLDQENQQASHDAVLLNGDMPLDCRAP